MSGIPADIMHTSTEIVDRIAKLHVWKGDCLADVASALMAERERCAKKVENFYSWADAEDEDMRAVKARHRDLLEDIATEIRTPEKIESGANAAADSPAPKTEAVTRTTTTERNCK
jgi:hypothetical protein